MKAIALMGKLASQSDAEAVIFAYCTDSGSEIYFPGNNAPGQITRFAYNIAFEVNASAQLEVTEAGAASLSDLDRFVSLHRAGDPTTGEVQTIRGRKTFTNEITLQSTLSSSSLIKTTGAVSGSTGIFGEAYLKTPNEVKQVYAYTNEDISRVQFKTVPVAISSESNAEIAITGTFDISATGGINVDGRLLPVQEYSYLGDSDHVWFYAHINELTAEEVYASAYGGAATQIKSDRVTGIYLTDSGGVNLSSVSPKDLTDVITNKAFALVGDDSRVGVGEICYIDLTRGLNDVKNVAFTIPRGTTVGTGLTFVASSNSFHLRALRQGSSTLLTNDYRFVILSSAVMPVVDSSQTVENVRTTVLAVCVKGQVGD
ncbi:MAG: hypothetical protein KIG72_06485 [Bradymonadales bacterium]|nr:hypothetical protein [Bradymonadales bacterium]